MLSSALCDVFAGILINLSQFCYWPVLCLHERRHCWQSKLIGCYHPMVDQITNNLRKYSLVAHRKTNLSCCLRLASTPKNLYCWPSSSVGIITFPSGISRPLLSATRNPLLRFPISWGSIWAPHPPLLPSPDLWRCLTWIQTLRRSSNHQCTAAQIIKQIIIIIIIE